MRPLNLLAGTVVMVGSVLVAAPTPAVAATTVPCSASALVSAVSTANTGGGGTLDLSSKCTYTLTAADNGENGLASITTPIIINGNGATIARSTSAPAFRFFNVTGSGNLTLNKVTLRNGRASNGGAIIVGAGSTLTLNSTTVTRNTATSIGGGGIINLGGTVTINSSTLSDNTGSQGAGLNNQGAGTTTFRNSLVSDNHAVVGSTSAAGGGIAVVNGSVALDGTRLIGNDATGAGAFGGGIASVGTVTLTNSLVADGAIDGANASGAGLWNSGTLNLTGSPVSSNTATGTNVRGSGIFNAGGTTTLNGLNPVVMNRAVGGGADGGGIFQAAGTVTQAPGSVAGNLPNNCGSPSTVTGCS